MKGLIVYNGFWNAQPPLAVTSLVTAAAGVGLTLVPVPNTALFARLNDAVIIEGETAPFALFWDKDVRLARAMEATGMRLYNTADAVALCDDKAATHLKLAANGIPMPETWVAPMTYVRFDEAVERFLSAAEQMLGYPLVVKECFGSLGGQVYLAKDACELRSLVSGLAARPFLLQRFTASCVGMDRRLYVVGDRVVAAMTRRNERDFRANVGSGGHGEPYSPTAEETALALRSCRLLGTVIAGVDLLYDDDGAPLVCEVNSSAQTKELIACTGVDVNREIACYVKACEQAENDGIS